MATIAVPRPRHLPARKHRRFTPDQLDRLPNAVEWEMLEDGTLRRRNLGAKSDVVAIEVATELRQQIAHSVGAIAGHTGLQIFPDRPLRIPRPDLYFISTTRVAQSGDLTGYLRMAPELIVEVVEQGDCAEAMASQAEEYLAGGALRVWVVDPDQRTVVVHRDDGSLEVLAAGDVITGEGVLPDFEIPVASFFRSLDQA
jgi:Uma2 family endonuclease